MYNSFETLNSPTVIWLGALSTLKTTAELFYCENFYFKKKKDGNVDYDVAKQKVKGQMTSNRMCPVEW